MNKKIKLLVLFLFLLLLIGANIFRYETLASKSNDSTVTKWYKDRWTGVTWISVFNFKGVKRFPADLQLPQVISTYEDQLKWNEAEQIELNTTRATGIWYLLLTINLIVIPIVALKKEAI